MSQELPLHLPPGLDHLQHTRSAGPSPNKLPARCAGPVLPGLLPHRRPARGGGHGRKHVPRPDARQPGHGPGGSAHAYQPAAVPGKRLCCADVCGPKLHACTLSHTHDIPLQRDVQPRPTLASTAFVPSVLGKMSTGKENGRLAHLHPPASYLAHAAPLLTWRVNPLLPCQLNASQDAKIVDKACICLGHIAEAFGNNATLLGVLNSSGLVVQALQLVGVSTWLNGFAGLIPRLTQ